MDTREAVIEQVQAHEEEIRRLHVRRLRLFGSFARNEQAGESDIDFLVEFEPYQKTFDHFMNLAFLLEDLLGRRIELVTAESLNPYIKQRVMKEAQDVLRSG